MMPCPGCMCVAPVFFCNGGPDVQHVAFASVVLCSVQAMQWMKEDASWQTVQSF